MKLLERLGIYFQTRNNEHYRKAILTNEDIRKGDSAEKRMGEKWRTTRHIVLSACGR
jgi:hypothetical protein